MFAPTDAAFAKVPKATLAALGKDKAKLKAVLLYHVVKGKVAAAQVVKLKSAKTLEGASLSIRVAGGKVYVGGAQVTKPDVMASNGVIHVINKVLNSAGDVRRKPLGGPARGKKHAGRASAAQGRRDRQVPTDRSWHRRRGQGNCSLQPRSAGP